MPLAGRRLTIARALARCYDAGFRQRGLTTAVAVMTAESSRYVKAYNVNTDGSVDRGLFQINDRWHPSLTDEDAYKAIPNIAYAFKISAKGTRWGLWTTYKTGAHLRFLPFILAVKALGRWKRFIR